MVLKFYTIGVDLGLYPRQGVTEGGATITIMSNWTEEEMAVALKAAVWDQLGGQGEEKTISYN